MVNHFRRQRSGPVLSSEAAARQGSILKLAIDALGATAAMAFLNGADEHLGGRPLDLAIASQEGFSAIADAIAQKHGDIAPSDSAIER